MYIYDLRIYVRTNINYTQYAHVVIMLLLLLYIGRLNLSFWFDLIFNFVRTAAAAVDDGF